MAKKAFLICFYAFLLIIAASCDAGTNSNAEKQADLQQVSRQQTSQQQPEQQTSQQQTLQQSAQQLSTQASQAQPLGEDGNDVLSGFEKTFAGVDRIEIQSDHNNAALSGNKPVVIRDGRIITDISDMVSHSIEANDASIANMSGMVTNNRMIVYKRDGSQDEINYYFDDPAFAKGYLEMNGKKYDPGYSFFRYMKDFTEYSHYDTNLDKQAVELFKKYEWTVDYRVNIYGMRLPDNLKHEAGEFPVKLYWAYNNELSKDIGLDYSGYLGKKVDAEIYRLREPLPDFLSPRMNARGIILRYDGKIIGAFIDAGRHDSFGCSLDRKSFGDITGKEWNAWVGGYIDYENGLEIKLSKMKPEEIISLYYDAMDRHDEKTQFACMTRRNLCSYLAMNMNNDRLFNEGFVNAFPDGYSNVISAKLIKTNKIERMGNPSRTVELEATVDFMFKKEITSSSGTQPRFLILVKESEKSGWRISSEGTGP